MIKQVSVSMDFFGIAGDSLLHDIMNQSSNNRARKTAFNNLFRLAKASGLVPRDARPVKVERAVDRAGQQHLQFVFDDSKRMPLADKGSP